MKKTVAVPCYRLYGYAPHRQGRYLDAIRVVKLFEGSSGITLMPEERSLFQSFINFFKGGNVARITLAARKFLRDEEGAALAEYGILVAFIAVVSITVITIFGRQISDKFQAISTALT